MDSAERREPSELVGWVLVTRLGADSWLGIVNDELYIGSETEPKRAVEVGSPVGLLPLLEHPHDEVMSDLSAREAEFGLVRGALAARIPLKSLPRVAVDTHIDYWVQLALDWCEASNSLHADRSVLETVVTSDWASQRAKHRAKKLGRF